MDAVPHPWSIYFTAQPSDIDELGHVNNAVWVRWIQDVATAHWRAVANSEQQGRFVWVIVRHEIDYRRPLLVGESVTGETWVADKATGARFTRYVRFIGADGRPHVEAKTDWAMIDRTTGRPQRVPAEMVAQFHIPSPPTA